MIILSYIQLGMKNQILFIRFLRCIAPNFVEDTIESNVAVQVINCWLPAATAWVQYKVNTVGFVMDEVLQYSLPILIPPTAPHPLIFLSSDAVLTAY
jgi:hypothetical protein